MPRLLVASTLVFALLAGCAVTSVGPEYRLKPEGDKGLVAVALTFSGAPLSWLSWNLRRSSAQTQGAGAQSESFVVAFGNKDPVDWPPPIGANVPETRLAGKVAVVELPAGDYEFFRWQARNAGYTFNSGRALSIRFKVKPGKATYIGDLHLFWENPKYGYRVFDRSQRDLGLIRKKVPLVTDDQIETELAEVADAKTPGK